MKRAVITGLSIVPSIGDNQQGVLASLREGRSGITFFQELKGSDMRSRVWGNVKLDTTNLIDRKIVRSISDASIYTFLSMEQVVAGVDLSPEVYQNNPRVGLITGSGGGSPCSQMFGVDAMRSPYGLRAVGPCVVTRTVAFGAFACLTIPLKIRGVNYSVGSTYTASTHCISNTIEQIQPGKQGIVSTGGGEELRWEIICKFGTMGVPSTEYSDTPEKAFYTYDTHRGGFVIAGGDDIVMAERLEHALARGTCIYVEIIGYGVASDGAGMAAPSNEGAVHYIKMTVRGVDTPVDYLSSHGTPTPIGDVKELAAIREVSNNKSPAIPAARAMTGHSLGAAGVQETVYFLLMLEHDFIAPSINIEESDEQTTDLNIVTETTDRELAIIMSNSFGFGNTNATLVTRKLRD